MALCLSECNTTVPLNVSRFSGQLKQSNRTNRDQTSNSFNLFFSDRSNSESPASIQNTHSFFSKSSVEFCYCLQFFCQIPASLKWRTLHGAVQDPFLIGCNLLIARKVKVVIFSQCWLRCVANIEASLIYSICVATNITLYVKVL